MGNFLKCDQKSYIMTQLPLSFLFTFVHLAFSVVCFRDRTVNGFVKGNHGKKQCIINIKNNALC